MKKTFSISLKFIYTFVVFFLCSSIALAQSSDEVIKKDIKESENTIKNNPSDSLHAELYMDLIWLYDAIDNAEQKFACAKKAHTSAYKTKYPSVKQRACMMLAMVYDHRQDYDNALKICEEALVQAEILLGTIAPHKRERVLYNKSALYNIMGGAYLSKKDNINALGFFIKAKDILDSISITNVARKPNLLFDVLQNIGLIYKAQKQYTQALIYYEQATTQFGNFDNPDKYDHNASLSTLLNNIGEIYNKQENYQKAIQNHQKGFEMASAVPDKTLMRLLLFSLGEDYLAMGNWEKAKNTYIKTYEIKENLENEYMNSLIKVRLCECFSNLKDYKEAERNCNEALIIAKKINAEDLILNVYEKQLPVYANLNKTKEFDSVFKEFNMLAEKRKDTQNQTILAEMQTKYEVKDKEQKISLLDREKRIQALEINEKGIALDFAELENLRKEDTIKIRNISLEKTQAEVTTQIAENQLKEQKINLSTKEISLKNNEISLKNAEIANGNLRIIILIVSLLAVAGLGLFAFSRFRLAKTNLKLAKEQEEVNRIRTILDTQENERTRIASELHDSVGAEVSALKLLAEKVIFKNKHQPELLSEFQKISAKAKTTVDNMREIVWAMGDNYNKIEDLVNYLRDYAQKYLRENDLQINISPILNIPDKMLSFEQRHNIFLTFKEVLHNIVKHAKASQVEVSILIDKNLKISIEDNGIGISEDKLTTFGNGLKNLQKRMNAIAGSFELLKPQTGTLVALQMPI